MSGEIILQLILFWPTLSGAECFFRRQHGQLMGMEDGALMGARVVNDIPQCERYCLEHLHECLAANLVPIRPGVYSCELINAISLPNLKQAKGGVFLLRTDFCKPNPCLNDGTCVEEDSGYFCVCKTSYTGLHCESKLSPVEISNCTSSSEENSNFTCELAFNNITDPGANNEWASNISDPEPRLTLTFARLTTIVYVDIWWRCKGSDQFSVVTFSFPNSEQVITHKCSTNKNWLSCGNEPAERFILDEVITNNVTIIGTRECDNSRQTGFREVKFWGY